MQPDHFGSAWQFVWKGLEFRLNPMPMGTELENLSLLAWLIRVSMSTTSLQTEECGCPRSSTGQSVGLRSQRLQVRILPGILYETELDRISVIRPV